MTDIKQVAKVAGVSVTTVSLVLNNKGNISAETRAHVLNIVEQLGYTRSVHARNLRDNQARIIGYTWDRKRSGFNPVLDNFLYEMVRLSEEQGRHLLLFTTDADNVTESYRALIRSKRVDGFLLSHTERNDERVAYLHSAGVPFVAFGRSLSPLDDHTHWADVDGRQGFMQVIDHLVAQGHRRIAMIAWPIGSASGDSRYAGYIDGLHAHGIAYDDSQVIRVENDTNHGYAAAQALLSRPNPPTAIACVSDALAFGAQRYLTEQGYRAAVTGFDDTPVASFVAPALTSVRQPLERIAKIISEMLSAQIEGRRVEQKQHLIAPELVIRQSSYPPD